MANTSEISTADKEKFYGIVADLLGLDTTDIADTSRLHDDLGADSLDCVELVMIVEREFDMSIPDQTAEELKVISDYYPVIADRN